MSSRSTAAIRIALVAILLAFVASLLLTLVSDDDSVPEPTSAAEPKPTSSITNAIQPEQVTLSADGNVSEQTDQTTTSCLEHAYSFSYSDQFVECVEDLLAAEADLDQLLQLYSHWLDVEWEAALNHAVLLDSTFSTYLLPNLLQSLAATALYSAIDWLAWTEIDEAFRGDLLADVYQTLAEQDPAYAIAEVTNLRDSDLKAQIINQLLERWASADAKAALAWVESQPQPQFYMDQKQAILWLWVEQSPTESGNYIKSMHESEMAKTIAAFYSHRLAEKNIDEAFEWLDELDSEAVYTAALIPVLELAVSDTRYQQQAMDKAMALVNQEDRDWAVVSIAVQMGAQNLPELVALYPDLPDTVKKDVAPLVAMNWAEYNPQEAVTWAQSLPAGLAADKAKYAIGEHYIGDDWQQAVAVANTIDAHAERLNLLKAVFEYAAETQPKQARQMLESLVGLSSRERQQLLAIVR